MRTARAKLDGSAYYHVMNRILERRYILTDEVAEQLRLLMRKVEAFTGVQVITYCIMTNHVHLLLRVPDRKTLSDNELLAKLEQLSSKSAFAQFMDKWSRMVEQKSESGLDELRQSVLARMFDISVFMKELKQRFTIWYNRIQKRQGTLWEDRFKSTLIENKPDYLATAAAYIDLNPVRAGMVKDPKDHRFCGYAEALAGDELATAGLVCITERYGVTGGNARSTGEAHAEEAGRNARVTLETYRMLLFGKGGQREEKAGFAPEEVEQVFEEKGALKPWVIAGHRLRWLTDGAVIGSKVYVQEFRTRMREKLGLKRSTGAYAAEESESLCCLRALRGEG